MPYISQKSRPKYLNTLTAYVKEVDADTTAGDLNYLITSLILEYAMKKGLSYETAKDIDGVLSHVAKEFYRRVIGPYEDKKIEENGDLYGFQQLIAQYELEG